jgi:hypothetical protein
VETLRLRLARRLGLMWAACAQAASPHNAALADDLAALDGAVDAGFVRVAAAWLFRSRQGEGRITGAAAMRAAAPIAGYARREERVGAAARARGGGWDVWCASLTECLPAPGLAAWPG